MRKDRETERPSDEPAKIGKWRQIQILEKAAPLFILASQKVAQVTLTSMPSMVTQQSAQSELSKARFNKVLLEALKMHLPLLRLSPSQSMSNICHPMRVLSKNQPRGGARSRCKIPTAVLTAILPLLPPCLPLTFPHPN